jgi:hypothetical protein
MLTRMPDVTLRLDGAIAVADYRCDAIRGATPFTEWHSRSSLPYVRRGSFGYHSRGRFFELVAGSVLTGQRGDEYMCTHDHVLSASLLRPDFFFSSTRRVPKA